MFITTFVRSLQALLGALLLAACAESESSADYVESNEEGLPYGAPDTQYDAVEIFTSDASAAFSDISSIAVTSDGDILVADAQNATITVLDHEGTVRRTLGRRGDGPGEFREPRALQILTNDSTLVFDARHRRLTVYTPESFEVAYTSMLDVPPGFSRAIWGQYASNLNLFLAAFVEPVRASEPPDPDDDETLRQRILRSFRMDGELQKDSILLGFGTRQLISRRGPVVGHGGEHPFGPTAPLALGPGGRLYVGQGGQDSLRVGVYSIDGRRTKTIVAPHESAAITDSDIERAIKEAVSAIHHETIRETAPDRWPSLRYLIVDSRGRAWATLGGPPDESTHVWIFESSGSTTTTSLTLPPGTEIMAVYDDLLYAARLDSLDVPRVIAYRVSTSDPTSAGKHRNTQKLFAGKE